MSVCVFPAKEAETKVRNCRSDCDLDVKTASCVVHSMASEVRELYEILMDNKRKMEILVQINGKIAEVLNSESEVLVK